MVVGETVAPNGDDALPTDGPSGDIRQSRTIRCLAELAKNGVSDRERIDARQRLLAVYRQQVNEFRQGKRKEITPILEHEIRAWGLRFAAELDPASAWATFLGQKRPRGKRAKNARRDLAIAVKVAKKMILHGMSLEEAADDVAQRRKDKPGCDRIVSIYKAYHKVARITVASAKGYL